MILHFLCLILNALAAGVESYAREMYMFTHPQQRTQIKEMFTRLPAEVLDAPELGECAYDNREHKCVHDEILRHQKKRIRVNVTYPETSEAMKRGVAQGTHRASVVQCSDAVTADLYSPIRLFFDLSYVNDNISCTAVKQVTQVRWRAVNRGMRVNRGS
jgi:hypothetical protein